MKQEIFPYLKRILQGADVLWKPLGEVAELKRGTSITKKTSNEGEIPVISGGQQPAYYIDQFNREGKTITVAGSGAYAGHVMYWEEPIFVGDAFSVKTDETILSTKYVYHFLLENQQKIYAMKKGSGVPHVYPKDLGILEIPIPPLSVQQEIVRILDKFTQLETELKTELKYRKQQYEHYRDELLTSDENEVEWKTLGEVGNVRMCKRILKYQTSPTGEIPFYKIGTFGKQPDAFISKEIFTEYKEKYNYPRKGEILISASGTIGRTVVFDGEDAYFKDSNIVWIENDEREVLNKFLFYYYKVVNWNISEGGTIKRLYNDNLSKIKIPIPPIEEQERIVGILDKFDTLVNSISEGLPREIELRRKQYEYYREKLLSFPTEEKTLSNNL